MQEHVPDSRVSTRSLHNDFALNATRAVGEERQAPNTSRIKRIAAVPSGQRPLLSDDN